jgi:hypothetical protein
MKKILLICIAITTIAITIKAQTPTLNGAQAGQTYILSTSLSNGVALDVINPYAWSEVSDVNNIATFSGATNAVSASVVIAGGATNVQQATVQVVANSATGTCPSSAQQLIIIVGNATFTAAVAATQSVCQNSTATIAVTLSKTAGSITGFSYFIDVNNNGVRDLGETLQAGTYVAPAATGTITLDTSVPGIQHIVISSISGTVGGFPVASVSTASQTVTVNAIPVINQITF